MVISAQVKHAVGDEKGKFAADAVAVFGCLFPDAGSVDDDISELEPSRLRVEVICLIFFDRGKISFGGKIDCRKRQYVCGPVDPAVFQVHAVDFFFICDQQKNIRVIGTFFLCKNGCADLSGEGFAVKVEFAAFSSLCECIPGAICRAELSRLLWPSLSMNESIE